MRQEVIKNVRSIDEWGVTYSLNGIYYLMKDIGMSWVSTRSRHPKQDEQAQTDFKKTLPN